MLVMHCVYKLFPHMEIHSNQQNPFPSVPKRLTPKKSLNYVYVSVYKTYQMRVLFCRLYLLHLWFSYNFRVLVRSHEPSASWLLREKSLCHQVSYGGPEGTNKLESKTDIHHITAA